MPGPILPTTTQADAFLDTIPEDQSVAQQRLANLSAASAVASSNSDDELQHGGSRRKDSGSALLGNRRRSKKRSGPGSISSSEAALVADQGESLEQAAASPSTSRQEPYMTKRRLAFSAVIVALLIAIVVGVYVVVSSTGGEGEEQELLFNATDEPSAPTSQATFPPGFIINLESEAPSPSPSFNMDDIADIDDTLLEISSFEDYSDPSTPQGKCRYWLTHTDKLELRVNLDGKERVRQRYILCVLYEATNGPSAWTIPFLDDSASECDWEGVSCVNFGEVNAILLPEINLQGALPEELTKLPTLAGLDMRSNSLTGSIPSALMQLPELVYMDLAFNMMTGTIPVDSGSLTHLDLGTNLLQGSLPYFEKLERLRVQKNLLTQFDPRYATLDSLISWNMYDNMLTGELPVDWDAPELYYIDLSENAWTGAIPTGLWNLPKLATLLLHDGQLTGTLPSTTISTAWRFLWLYSNRLSGSIPESMGANWVNLTELKLHDNLLTGSINEDHCANWSNLEQLKIDCSLPCACCTECFE